MGKEREGRYVLSRRIWYAVVLGIIHGADNALDPMCCLRGRSRWRHLEGRVR
jgi:hypothetical protein